MKSLASRVALATGSRSGGGRAIALAHARKKPLTAQHPVARSGEFCEVTALVLGLSQTASSFVTGGYLLAEGGYLAR